MRRTAVARDEAGYGAGALCAPRRCPPALPAQHVTCSRAALPSAPLVCLSQRHGRGAPRAPAVVHARCRPPLSAQAACCLRCAPPPPPTPPRARTRAPPCCCCAPRCVPCAHPRRRPCPAPAPQSKTPPGLARTHALTPPRASHVAGRGPARPRGVRHPGAAAAQAAAAVGARARPRRAGRRRGARVCPRRAGRAAPGGPARVQARVMAAVASAPAGRGAGRGSGAAGWSRGRTQQRSAAAADAAAAAALAALPRRDNVAGLVEARAHAARMRDPPAGRRTRRAVALTHPLLRPVAGAAGADFRPPAGVSRR
jgi:hypothetical protein